MENQERNQILLHKLPFAKDLFDGGVHNRVTFDVLVNVTEAGVALFVLNVHIIAIHQFNRTDSLNFKKELIRNHLDDGRVKHRWPLISLFYVTILDVDIRIVVFFDLVLVLASILHFCFILLIVAILFQVDLALELVHS
jgi:hypothetical protein